MVVSFTNGESIDQLSEKYKITKLTITKHLKKEIDLKTFKTLTSKKSKIRDKSNVDISTNIQNETVDKPNLIEEQSYIESSLVDSEFIEITPLNYDIENEPQRDLTSVSISETTLPKIVYMVVDKKIELEIKLLKDFPEWDFLPNNDLKRKTIEIFFDLNLAKSSCSKDQKVLKVPNTNVFRIATPILLEKGISRIVCPENLIAL